VVVAVEHAVEKSDAVESFASQAAFLAKRTLSLPPSIILSSTVINLLALALPLVIRQVFDRVLPNQSMGTLYVLAGTLMAVTAFEALLKLARSYLVEQQALARRLQHAPAGSRLAALRALDRDHRGERRCLAEPAERHR
jgi:ABC-type bacteriocin/lantibiotic exporter with double-glycine peptidase domain